MSDPMGSPHSGRTYATIEQYRADGFNRIDSRHYVTLVNVHSIQLDNCHVLYDLSVETTYVHDKLYI